MSGGTCAIFLWRGLLSATLIQLFCVAAVFVPDKADERLGHSSIKLTTESASSEVPDAPGANERTGNACASPVSVKLAQGI